MVAKRKAERRDLVMGQTTLSEWADEGRAGG